MPNTKPPTTSAEALAAKVAAATHRMHCDFAFFVGATRDNVDDLAELELQPGAAGIKVFMGSSTGDLLVDDEETLARILAASRRRAAFHSEDEARLKQRMKLQREGDPSSHSEWRDVGAALASTERLLRVAAAAGKRVHVLHVSTGEEMALLALHKDIASVEVTPQHLTLATPEAYEILGTRAQMNPPLRDREHQQRLWWGLEQGVVDVLGSDHAPHTLEEKSKSYPATPSGMPGVQTLVPVMLDHVNAGRLSLARFVDLTSAGPQRIFGIAGKGRIAVGYDADLTIVDLKAERVIDNEWIGSKCGWTPFAGTARRRLAGRHAGSRPAGHVGRRAWRSQPASPSASARRCPEPTEGNIARRRSARCRAGSRYICPPSSWRAPAPAARCDKARPPGPA